MNSSRQSVEALNQPFLVGKWAFFLVLRGIGGNWRLLEGIGGNVDILVSRASNLNLKLKLKAEN